MIVADLLFGVFRLCEHLFFVMLYQRSVELLSSVFVVVYPLIQCLLKLVHSIGAPMFERPFLTDREICEGLRVFENTKDRCMIRWSVELEFCL